MTVKRREHAPGIVVILFSLLGLFVMVVAFAPVPAVRAAVSAEDFNILSAPGRYNSIGAADIDGDGRTEVVFGDYNGYIMFLEFDRTTNDFILDETLQTIQIDSNRVWGLKLFDIDPEEEGIEVVAGDGKGEIYVYSGKTGDELAYFEGISRDAHGLYIHDFDRDGDFDIGVGTQYKNDDPNGMFYILDYKYLKEYKADKGETMDKPAPWYKTAKANSRWRSIDVGDIDRDGEEEIIIGCGAALGDVGGEGYVRIFNATLKNHKDPLAAKAEWESEDLEGCIQGVNITDIDGDGDLEFVCAGGYRYNDGWIYIFEYDGGGEYEQVWRSENVGPKPFGFLVEDIDDDGTKEIVVGNQPGRIYIVDGKTHETEWTSPLLGTDVMGLTALDLDLVDDQLELIAAQGGYQGKGDYTSGYTTPHLYVIDGKTHEIEHTLGDKDFVELTLQIILLALIIVFLVELGVLTKLLKTGGKK